LFGRVWKILKSIFSLGSLNNSGLSVRNYSSIAVCFSGGVRIASSVRLASKNEKSRRNRTGVSKNIQVRLFGENVAISFIFQYFNIASPNGRDFRHSPEHVFGGLAPGALS
jgi:hypothetical protein